MKVLVKGPLLSVTGYGTHTRQIWKWARSKNWDVRCEIVPWGMCTYYVNPEAENGLIADIMERSGKFSENEKPDMSIQVQLPDEWNPNLAKINIGVTAGIEADRCHQRWIAASEKMDRVIVPSKFSKEAFLNGGLDPKKIISVPEAITCEFEKTEANRQLTEKLDQLPTSFNFLVFGQMTGQNSATDRKNTFNCIKWLCEEFKDDPNVGIILKTNMGRMTCQDRSVTNKIINKVLKEVRVGQFPKLYVFHGLMDGNELTAIFKHKKVKALCAPTRGEGWGLPILDATACGLPVIATRHSGHLDFLSHVKYLQLDYELQEIPSALADGRIWVPGARWAEPKEDHFKARVRKLRDDAAFYKQRASQDSSKINKLFSIDTVMKKYDEALHDLIHNS